MDESTDPPECPVDCDADAINTESAQKDKEMCMNLLRKAAALIRASNALPKAGDNFELCSSYGVFTEYMQVSRERILTLMGKLYSASGVRMRMPKEIKDLSEFMDRVIDGNDIIAERAGILLDEIERTRRREKVVVPKAIAAAESTARALDATTSGASLSQKLTIPIKQDLQMNIANLARLRAIARHRETISKVVQIKKPQKEYGFGESIDNSMGSFVPKLHTKHNSINKPNGEGMVIREEGEDSGARPWVSDEGECVHPYNSELERFEVEASQLVSKSVQDFQPLDSSHPTVVSSKEDLEKLRDTLNQVSEFAVDLEHHDYRSFLGFTCLIQISTRNADFIVDPFPLWEHMNMLNEPFTNPKILKVLHGADRDVEWLQRDFGIYCVNLFDTGRAMRHLGMPKYSLQYLVQDYCGVTLNKQYQTTDWRVRPLPEEMVQYAREDTHYLLYCYDRLREKLLERGNQDTNNLLKAVYTDSTTLCKKVFEKPQFDASGFSSLIATRRSLNNRQLHAMRQLWKWRDETARLEDESLSYVLPTHMMMHIAESLPRDMQSILACCSPIPVCVKEHLLVLHKIILDARDRPLEKVTSSTSSDDTNLPQMKKAGRKTNSIDAVTGMLLTSLNVHFDDDEDDMNVKIDVDDDIIEKFQFKDIDRSFLSVFCVKDKLQGDLDQPQTQSVLPDTVDRIRQEFSDMASPYECYLLAMKDRDKRLAKQRETDAKLKKLAEETGEKRYTHRDATVCRKPVFEESSSSFDGKLSIGQKDAAFREHQTLTREGLKRKMIADRKAADIFISGPSSEKKPKKLVEESEEGDMVVNFDYSQHDDDTQMFEQRPGNTTYNPFGRGTGRGGRGGGGRGRGGRGGRGRGRGDGERRGTRGTNRGKMNRSSAGSIQFKA